MLYIKINFPQDSTILYFTFFIWLSFHVLFKMYITELESRTGPWYYI